MAGQVFVSGGSGYIAGFLIKQLIAEGWTVHTSIRNLAREEEVRGWLGVDNSKLKFFAADLMSDDGWAEAMAGCTHVAHVASPLPSNAPKSDDELIVPAREGALRALRFAHAAGIKRFVMTSSVAAIAYGHGKGKQHFTEADWTDVNSPDAYAYVKSKTIADRAARARLDGADAASGHRVLRVAAARGDAAGVGADALGLDAVAVALGAHDRFAPALAHQAR